MDQLISCKDLIQSGYSKDRSQKIIREARRILVERGYTFYSGTRIMVVPRQVVYEVLGVEF